jgi:hypothetical protein
LSNSGFGLHELGVCLVSLGEGFVQLRLHAVARPVVVVAGTLHKVVDQRFDVDLSKVNNTLFLSYSGYY